MRRLAVTLTLAVLASVTAFAVGGTAPAGAAACDKTWANAGVSGVWDQVGVANGTETQWSPTGVPGATDNVCLPSGAYSVLFNTGDAASYTVASLTVGSGGFAGGPALVIGPGRTVTSTGAIAQSTGLIELRGTLVGTTFTLSGGRFVGNGTLTANVTNSGGVFGAGEELELGDPHVDTFLALNGSYTQTAGGTYHVDIDGNANGVNQSHTHVSGTATLAGAVELDMTKRPTPPPPVLLANGGITGTFSSALGAPLSWFGIVPGGGAVEQVVVVPSPSFPDVGLTHPFFADIEWLVARGITSGFADGGFHPTTSVTRQSMAAFLYRMAGSPAYTPPDEPFFPDVTDTHPFFKEIQWLGDTAIAYGYEDGTFHPSSPVSRQAMAAFLFALSGYPTFTQPPTPTFNDADESNEFIQEIEWLAHYQITGGFPDGGFHPTDKVTRQSMAAFIHRYFSNGLVVDTHT